MTQRAFFTLGLSLLALTGVGIGVYSAMHSSMFAVQVVEVADLPDQAPVDAQSITTLAAVPVGEVNLFDLDLKVIEQRIMRNPWIREVHLQKRFPQTLSIGVTFREPQALIQSQKGALAYVDRDGKIFGQINLMHQEGFSADLPLLSGFTGKHEAHIATALKLLNLWNQSPLAQSSQISSLTWDGERGYRALVTYPLKQRKEKGPKGRTLIDLGDFEDIKGSSRELEAQLKRLSQVFHYLGANSIVVRQIWADSGKKIVVKTAKGS